MACKSWNLLTSAKIKTLKQMGVPHTAEQSENKMPTTNVSKEPTLCCCGKSKTAYCDGTHMLEQKSANSNNGQ
jgi:CDGSH-type Zn-finger protein